MDPLKEAGRRTARHPDGEERGSLRRSDPPSLSPPQQAMSHGLHVCERKSSFFLPRSLSLSISIHTCTHALKVGELRYNRAEIIEGLRWKVGAKLPEEIQEKLSFSEKEFFKNHSGAIESFMSELDIDLTVV